MSELRITLVQSSLFWEDKQANLNQFEQQLNSIDEPTDAVVLPEMFNTGFSMNPALAESMDGMCVTWMRNQAKRLGVPVAGSVMISENDSCYNRFVWMNPDGTYSHYNKRHLFRMGNEHSYFSPGEQQVVVDYKGWKLQLSVCYDLRFPVWMRRTSQQDYDAIVIVANWPDRRIAHWRALLLARAIENQSYIVAVNRIGVDGNGLNHVGSSGLISPRGEWVNDIGDRAAAVTVVLHKHEVTEWRTAFPAADDADTFRLS